MLRYISSQMVDRERMRPCRFATCLQRSDAIMNSWY